MTSPIFSADRDSTISRCLTFDFVLVSCFSVSEISRRRAAYSPKSPRSQCIDFSYAAIVASFFRTLRARPTTALSAWNCANEVSRTFAASAGLIRESRFAVML